VPQAERVLTGASAWQQRPQRVFCSDRTCLDGVSREIIETPVPPSATVTETRVTGGATDRPTDGATDGATDGFTDGATDGASGTRASGTRASGTRASETRASGTRASGARASDGDAEKHLLSHTVALYALCSVEVCHARVGDERQVAGICAVVENLLLPCENDGCSLERVTLICTIARSSTHCLAVARDKASELRQLRDEKNAKIRLLDVIVDDSESDRAEAKMLESCAVLFRCLDPDIVCSYDTKETLEALHARSVSLELACLPLGRTGHDVVEFDLNRNNLVRLDGRIVLSMMRTMRMEMRLVRYTREALARWVLKQRFPRIFDADLTRGFAAVWRACRTGEKRRRGAGSARTASVCERACDDAEMQRHLARKAALNLGVLARGGVVRRSAAYARIVGIKVEEVHTRGAQFRVEALLLRATRGLGVALPSASAQQVRAQDAMECAPLVLESAARLLVSPVAVLDFRSLYPSVIVAHNLCYSTLIGRLRGSPPTDLDRPLRAEDFFLPTLGVKQDWRCPLFSAGPRGHGSTDKAGGG
ncbi:MAG: hypothetical protein MHM6MM_008729, partial [Cercozoa sp. M6MM]